MDDEGVDVFGSMQRVRPVRATALPPCLAAADLPGILRTAWSPSELSSSFSSEYPWRPRVTAVEE